MSGASAPLLELDGVRARYGRIEALHGISLRVHEGEIVAVIGANGAGKTTTLACAAGLHSIAAGRATFAGHDLTMLRAHQTCAMGLALVPEGRRIFARMSVRENLLLGAYLRHDQAAIESDIAKMVELFPVLGQRMHQTGGTLSGGEQQMLAIARALMSRPRLLMLDEPSMGVAPILVQRIFSALERLHREEHVTLLLVEQNARLALKLAHRAYVLETGTTSIEGPSAELLNDARVQRCYLGG